MGNYSFSFNVKTMKETITKFQISSFLPEWYCPGDVWKYVRVWEVVSWGYLSDSKGREMGSCYCHLENKERLKVLQCAGKHHKMMNLPVPNANSSLVEKHYYRNQTLKTSKKSLWLQ